MDVQRGVAQSASVFRHEARDEIETAILKNTAMKKAGVTMPKAVATMSDEVQKIFARKETNSFTQSTCKERNSFTQSTRKETTRFAQSTRKERGVASHIGLAQRNGTT